MDIHSLVQKVKGLEKETGKTPTRQELISSGVSDWQLRKIKFSTILDAAGMTSVKYDKKEDNEVKLEMLIRPPNILYFDIESVGLEVKTYSLKTDYISPKNVLKDWSLLSYAASFESDPEKFYYLDQRFNDDKRDDEQLAIGLHAVLTKSDIIIGHNVDSFDLKKFNTKAAKYGLEPLSQKITYDTLKIARKYFAVTSNSLWFLANFFNLPNRKSEHGKFPGAELWDQCMAGNLEAWEENEDYNKQDVLTTRDLFKYLARYDSRINFQAFFQTPTCSCGNQDFYRDGEAFTRQGRFNVYRCTECKKPYTSKENLIDKETRKEFFK
jgi:DNA polymerase III epsilon subunit-like protein